MFKAAAIICLFCVPGLTAPVRAQTPVTAALIDIDATSSLEQKIGDGGFDYRAGSGRYFFATLDKCGERVSAVAVAWAKRHQLPVLLQDVTSARALLHFSVPRIKGLIEVSYSYTSLPEKARLTMYLKKSTGETFDAEIDDLKALQIAAFKDALVEALKCG
jgi:hypothetical protein